MAVKKTVAASNKTTIPETATGADELKISPSVTASQPEVVEETAFDAGAVAKSKIQALAKARAAKAAKAAARVAAQEEINGLQAILAAEKANDDLSFGEIREVVRTMPTKEEYVKVEIPATDLFDHTHPGVQLNRHRFDPGRTYLLRGDVALEVKRRLLMFHNEQVRLLRPNADRKALSDVNRGSQWTSRGSNSIVPLGRLEDVAVASDEKIYTVDF
jgi:hypothetical protein